MTAATLAPFLSPAGPGEVPMSPKDVSKKLAELHKNILQAGGGDKNAALEAMRRLWEWICSMIDRIARACGLKADAAQREMTEEQLTGEAPTEIELSPDGSRNAPMDVTAAQDTVVGEANRLIQFLSDNPVDPAILANPETAGEFIRFQAEKLNSYHGVFKDRAEELDVEINEKCAAIASVAGTTGPVIRAQLASNSDGGVYDKDGSIKLLLDEAKKMRLAMGRVELVALSLVDASSHPTAVQGLREKTIEIFSKHFPGIDLDRAPPPPKSIAEVSGATLAGTSIDDDLVQDTPDVGQQLDATSLIARNGIPAKNNLEFAGLAGLGKKSSNSTSSPGLRVVSSGSAPLVTEVERQEAMASSFATSGFANLTSMSKRRREKSGTDWGDHPVDR